MNENEVEEIMRQHIELMSKALTPRGVGECHAAFDDAIDAYVAFNNGTYDAGTHRKHVRAVCLAGERLLQALNRGDPRAPWILRRR